LVFRLADDSKKPTVAELEAKRVAKQASTALRRSFDEVFSRFDVNF
jgi:hypothetical protein